MVNKDARLYFKNRVESEKQMIVVFQAILKGKTAIWLRLLWPQQQMKYFVDAVLLSCVPAIRHQVANSQQRHALLSFRVPTSYKEEDEQGCVVGCDLTT